MPKFSDLLDRKAEEIKRPPNLPEGHYIWQVMKHPELSERADKEGNKLEVLTFTCACVAPSDDVDPDEVEAYGDVTKAVCRKDFLFNNGDDAGMARTEFQLRQFLEALGLDLSKAIQELLVDSVNGQFTGELAHRPDKNDPEIVYQEIKRTFPAA